VSGFAIKGKNAEVRLYLSLLEMLLGPNFAVRDLSVQLLNLLGKIYGPKK